MTSSELGWGCLVLVGLGTLAAAFGIDAVGRSCILFALGNVAVQALRTGRFPNTFGRSYCDRATNPIAYWMMLGICLVLAALSAWYVWEAISTKV